LINIFFVIDILLLFIFFELIVLPLFFFVGVWGSRDRKIYASYLLFIYTLLGSALALFGFLILYLNKGSLNFIYFNNTIFLENYQVLLVFLLFFGFSVKVPIVPMHIWLPEAHVEAPTVGSVILAGIILKLGIYIYLRLIIFSFSYIISILVNYIYFIALISVYISSFSAIAQIDIKKVIAYSSIAHMNFALVGLFCNNLVSLLGSFFMMFGHAFVSGALFFCIGMLYDRYKTRLLFYYGGLVVFMPIWSTLFFIFILGNFGLPGTVNFVGEFIIFIGTFYSNNSIIILLILGLFLTLVYSLLLFNRLVFGKIKIEFIRFFSDLSRREVYILFILFIFVIYFGLKPNILFDYSFSSLFFWFFF
jgi:proton-translocating NADH-quinone oxidoreductase chain M